MWIEQRWAPVVLLLFVVGCGAEPAERGGGAASVEGAALDAATGGGAEAEPPATVADLFPEGEGRALVLSNCASCHAVACVAMGQRTAARWGGIREAHREHLPGLDEEELAAIFAYLQENFDDTRPEPEIPPAFLQGGCTPF